jgi:chemotaxis methyl-accepting protein methylase
MLEKPKNIIEDVAKEFLDSALTLRYDICTCPTCRNDMLAYILSRVPAKYVTTEQGALHTIIQQAKAEQQAEIGRAMLTAIAIVSKSPRHKLKEDKNQTFQMLLDKIKEDRGLDFRHYHRDLLKRRVAIRLRANNIETYWEYLMLLIKNPEEYDKLFGVLCINVSEFFRDPEVWEKFAALFENLIRQKTQAADNSIRVWSAGCANGEEPYSIAIVLNQNLIMHTPNFRVEISATDVDKKSLKFAEKAEYLKEYLKNVDKKFLKRYFCFDGKIYRVKDDIRKLVDFQNQDLTSQDFIKDVDVVFCRNVFIYFDRSLQEQLLMKFYKALKPNGYLIMGKAETLISEAKEIFKEIDFESHIYMKK